MGGSASMTRPLPRLVVRPLHLSDAASINGGSSERVTRVIQEPELLRASIAGA